MAEMNDDLPPQTSPKSLLDMCTQLVATHLDIVESLHGLPSLIGEQIFSVGWKSDKFVTDVEYSTRAVELFTEAYGEEFLSRLNISGEYLGLNYYLDQLLLFTDLVELDLSDCGLGDEHEMLVQFAYLHRLEMLSLRNNSMTDAGIQKMTAPYRMFQRGPKCLRTLDLRGNAVTRYCLKYLTKFASLKTIMFTEKRKDNSNTKHSGALLSCWNLQEGEVTDYDIQTEGWAKVLIERWMLEAKRKSLKTKPMPKTGMFTIRRYPEIGTNDLLSENLGSENMLRLFSITAQRVDNSGVDINLKAVVNDKRDEPSITLKEDLNYMKEFYGDIRTANNDCQQSLIQQLDYAEKETPDKSLQSQSNCKGKQKQFLFRKSSNESKKIYEQTCSVKGRRPVSKIGISETHNVNIRTFMMKKIRTEKEKLKDISDNDASCGTLSTNSVSFEREKVDTKNQPSNVRLKPKIFTNQSSIEKSLFKSCSTTSSDTHSKGRIDLSMSLNSKSRKRKITVMKNKTDLSIPGKCVNDKSANYVQVENFMVDKENVQPKKRVKSSFLQYLD